MKAKVKNYIKRNSWTKTAPKAYRQGSAKSLKLFRRVNRESTETYKHRGLASGKTPLNHELLREFRRK